MNTDIERAVTEILNGAESGIRSLIGKAAENQHYDDIVLLVHLARQLNELVPKSVTTDGSKQIQSVAIASSLSQKGVVTSSAKADLKSPKPSKGSMAKRYPIFSTNSERLIKLGWSKKNRAEYEHRAPKASVEIVHQAIKKIGAAGDSFEVEALSPLLTPDNQEIPGYQIYMAIGWLRELGAVQKSGRNKYRITPNGSDPFDTYWARAASN